MNPIILSFTDGTIFFVGLVVVLVAELLLLCLRQRLVRPVLSACVFVGIIFVAISSTPLSFWMYALWGIAVLVALIVGQISRSLRYVRVSVGRLLLMVTVGIGVAEASFRCMPQVMAPKGRGLFMCWVIR